MWVEFLKSSIRHYFYKTKMIVSNAPKTKFHLQSNGLKEQPKFELLGLFFEFLMKHTIYKELYFAWQALKLLALEIHLIALKRDYYIVRSLGLGYFLTV